MNFEQLGDDMANSDSTRGEVVTRTNWARNNWVFIFYTNIDNKLHSQSW